MPYYNSIFRFLEDAELYPIMLSMIERASLPLRSVESIFAGDSTGFTASRFLRWFDVKYNRFTDTDRISCIGGLAEKLKVGGPVWKTTPPTLSKDRVMDRNDSPWRGYVAALVRDWIFLMSGIGSIILQIAGALNRNALPAWTFWVASIIFFAVACYRVLRLEHKRVLELEKLLEVDPVAIERRKIIKAKYDKLEPDAQAALRQIAIEGSVATPALTADMPRFWFRLQEEGLTEGSQNRIKLASAIATDIIAVIKEEMKTSAASRL